MRCEIIENRWENQCFCVCAGAISTVVIVRRKRFPGSQTVSQNPSKSLENATKINILGPQMVTHPAIRPAAANSRYHALQGWALSYSCTVWCIQLAPLDSSRTHMAPRFSFSAGVAGGGGAPCGLCGSTSSASGSVTENDIPTSAGGRRTRSGTSRAMQAAKNTTSATSPTRRKQDAVERPGRQTVGE